MSTQQRENHRTWRSLGRRGQFRTITLSLGISFNPDIFRMVYGPPGHRYRPSRTRNVMVKNPRHPKAHRG